MAIKNAVVLVVGSECSLVHIKLHSVRFNLIQKLTRSVDAYKNEILCCKYLRSP